jgi:hypothetical protein
VTLGTPTRVAVVDDHDAVWAGLNALLTTEPGILPVGDADRAEAVWPLLEGDPDGPAGGNAMPPVSPHLLEAAASAPTRHGGFAH